MLKFETNAPWSKLKESWNKPQNNLLNREHSLAVRNQEEEAPFRRDSSRKGGVSSRDQDSTEFNSKLANFSHDFNGLK